MHIQIHMYTHMHQHIHTHIDGTYTKGQYVCLRARMSQGRTPHLHTHQMYTDTTPLYGHPRTQAQTDRTHTHRTQTHKETNTGTETDTCLSPPLSPAHMRYAHTPARQCTATTPFAASHTSRNLSITSTLGTVQSWKNKS